MRVLGIDPGGKALGWCLINGMNRIVGGTIRNREPHDIVNTIEQKIMTVSKKLPALVIIEHGNNDETCLAQTNALISWADRHNIPSMPIEPVPPKNRIKAADVKTSSSRRPKMTRHEVDAYNTAIKGREAWYELNRP